jgi:hypothetical protein
MGIRIFVPDEAAAIPRAVVLELTCDGDHGFLPPAQTFAQGGFISQHDAAMRAGWKEAQGPNGRLWMGPCCSGKSQTAAIGANDG